MSSDSGTFRRLNRSLAWRELERSLLADAPTCGHCGMHDAVEAHRRDGCFVAEELRSDDDALEALCMGCHDDVCPTRDAGSHLLLRHIEAHE